MDKKQLHILNNIYKKFNLKGNKKFIQHRNLKEFRYFFIEKINPNHKIILYGKLRKQYVNDKCHNRIINVGEIIIYSCLITLDFNSIVINGLCGFILTYFLIDLINIKNPFEVLNAYWCRRFTKFRQIGISS